MDEKAFSHLIFLFTPFSVKFLDWSYVWHTFNDFSHAGIKLFSSLRMLRSRLLVFVTLIPFETFNLLHLISNALNLFESFLSLFSFAFSWKFFLHHTSWLTFSESWENKSGSWGRNSGSWENKSGSWERKSGFDKESLDPEKVGQDSFYSLPYVPLQTVCFCLLLSNFYVFVFWCVRFLASSEHGSANWIRAKHIFPLASYIFH